MTLKEAGLQYVKDGFNILVVQTTVNETTGKITRKPTQSGWQERTQTEESFLNEYARPHKDPGPLDYIGITCGELTNNIEVIDIDCKNDDTGQVWQKYSDIIKNERPDIWQKMVIQKTKSNGYHLIYQFHNIPGGQHLAKGENGAVTIETRARRQYINIAPSPGYEFLQGDLYSIQYIDDAERDFLLNAARSLNLFVKPKETQERERRTINEAARMKTSGQYNDVSPFKDFNLRATIDDILKLFFNAGWSESKRDAHKIYLLRPGSTDTEYSGNLLIKTGVFHNYSTSAIDFDIEKAYNPAAIYTALVAGGNLKEARRLLLEDGYGKPDTWNISNVSTTIETQSGTMENYDPGDHVTIEAILEAERVIINADDAAETGDVCNEIYKYYGAEKNVYVRTPDYPEAMHGWKFYISVINDYINKWTDIQHDDFINKSLALRPLLFGHNLSQYTDAICDYFGLDLQSVEDDTRKRKEKRKKEIEERKRLALLSQIKDAAEAGNLEAVKKLSYELNKTDDASDRLNFMQPYTRDQHIHEMTQKREGIYSGYDIEGSKLFIPATDILFIAGYTGMNKTGFLINLALNAIEHGEANNKYLFLTMEQTKGDILNRFINTYVNIDRIGMHDVNNTAALEYYYKNGADEKHLYHENRSQFLERESRFFADVLPKINIQYVEGTADSVIDAIREYKKAVPDLAGVFIDQMSFMVLSGEKKKKEKINSRQEELKHICDELKELKNNTHLSLIIAVQISRKGHESGLKDLTGISESGDIERVGHTILGIQDMRINNELRMVILKRRSDRTGIETRKIYIPYSRKVTNEDAQYFVQNENGDITEVGSKKTYSQNGTKPKKKAPERHDAAMKRKNPDPDLLNYNNN